MQNIRGVFSSNLKRLLKEKNITQLELADYIGVSDASVNNWANGKKMPRMDKVDKICKYLKIKRSDLIEDKSDLSNIPGVIPLEKIRKIPILGTISCGEPIFADENYEGYFIADSSIKASFALRAKGASMIEANINDGNLVLLRKDFEFINGNIYAVLIDDEATLKRVYKTGNTYTLNPANVNYQPIVLTDNEEAMILGEMVGVYQVRSK